MSERKISRRQFISILAAAGATFALGLPALKKYHQVSRSRLVMGTIVNLTLISPDRAGAEAAAEACLAEMASLEKILSRHLPESQLSSLNLHGSLENPHPALRDLITQSRQLSELSSGAFDITVKPLQDLYQSEGGTPSPDQIQDVLQLIGYQHLLLEGGLAYYAHPGMAVTLDGIAKGYIVDAGVDLLKVAGFKDVLVEAGGDLTASGSKSSNSPWTIGLQDPRKAIGEILTRVALRDRSLATSGDYLQSYTLDQSSHHILDPRTGFSPPDFSSVSVSAPSASLADGLATALMVMGQEGLELIDSLSDCEAFTISKDGCIKRTTGFIEA